MTNGTKKLIEHLREEAPGKDANSFGFIVAN
jgi:hypothetical protein